MHNKAKDIQITFKMLKHRTNSKIKDHLNKHPKCLKLDSNQTLNNNLNI